MLDKKEYANGQKVYELKDDHLTFYFKNGRVKAEGDYQDSLMEGEWKFYRETGQLWQVGSFKKGEKNGAFTRFNRNNEIEYQETFEGGKKVKK